MNRCSAILLGLAVAVVPLMAQTSAMQIPKTVSAGSSFSIGTTGSGDATLYIVGPGGAFKRKVQLGNQVEFGPSDITTAGHYSMFVVSSSSTESAQFDVVASSAPASISFLAKPSRLPVSLHNGISGVAYVFDIYRNLILQPTPVTFQLSSAEHTPQSRTETTRDGVAWIKLDSPASAGSTQFDATAGDVIAKRVIEDVPGEACNLKMSAHGSGQRIVLQTEPVRDCSGNAVPDGTVVTFTETYNGEETTADVPLKRGIATTDMPLHAGAVISVAAGVATGNEVRWGAGQ